MQKTALVFLITFFTGLTFAQDMNTSEGLISIFTEKIDGYDFKAYYHSLKNEDRFRESLSNKEMFLNIASENPSLIFVLAKDQNNLYGIIPVKKYEENKRTNYYQVIDFSNENKVEMKCSVKGDICGLRAEEIIELGIIPELEIVQNDENRKILAMEEKEYEIQEFSNLKAEVHLIADELISYRENSSAKVRKYILEQSIGGKLDFNEMLQEKNQKDLSFPYKNAELTRNQYSVLLWGGAVGKLGIENIDEAVELWEEVNQREISYVEETMLREGYFGYRDKSQSSNNK